MTRVRHNGGAPRLLGALAAICACWLLAGASSGRSFFYPAGYESTVAMWRRSGGNNGDNAAALETASWATVLVPYSMLANLQGPEMTDDPLCIARRELARGRYGATLPFFRHGVGTIVVINDVRLAELEPTEQGRAREKTESGYLEHVRQVTLAAVLAHECTHSLQFMKGEIYPGPGTLPFPGHDQTDEMEAYLNINAIYQSELGLALPRSRYEAIIKQDYANLPDKPVSMHERSRAFIEQRALLDRQERRGPPLDFDDALARVTGNQERL